jgi:glyoxylase-like metal-dependent hydrolase (beta-lactamase superfamily II)
MTLRQIASKLYQIALPTPFPVGPVNAYLAIGTDGRLSLIDTGPRTDAARIALALALAEIRCSLTDIERIIVTHNHIDHYGMAGDIAKVSEAKVYSHPRNRALLKGHSAERDRSGSFYRNLLMEAGAPPGIQAAVLQVLGGFRQLATPLSSVHALEEGDELRLAGRYWQVLYMPGHTGGLICLYQPETQLFLGNDHLLRDISTNPMVEPPLPGQTRRRRSLVDYIASLERTAKLEISVAWPGHGEPIYDHRSLIKDRLAFHHRRAEKIVAVLQSGPQTVFDVSQILFPDLEPMDRFLAMSEVLAHLEWLEDQGAVLSQPRNGRVFWQAT